MLKTFAVINNSSVVANARLGVKLVSSVGRNVNGSPFAIGIAIEQVVGGIG